MDSHRTAVSAGFRLCVEDNQHAVVKIKRQQFTSSYRRSVAVIDSLQKSFRLEVLEELSNSYRESIAVAISACVTGVSRSS